MHTFMIIIQIILGILIAAIIYGSVWRYNQKIYSFVFTIGEIIFSILLFGTPILKLQGFITFSWWYILIGLIILWVLYGRWSEEEEKIIFGKVLSIKEAWELGKKLK